MKHPSFDLQSNPFSFEKGLVFFLKKSLVKNLNRLKAIHTYVNSLKKSSLRSRDLRIFYSMYINGRGTPTPMAKKGNLALEVQQNKKG